MVKTNLKVCQGQCNVGLIKFHWVCFCSIRRVFKWR